MAVADHIAEAPTMETPRAAPGAQTRKRTVAGYAALGLALVACPCHLPLTLGLAAALLGGVAGTAAAARITEHLATALALGAALFVGSLAAGFWLLQGRHTQAPRTESGATN